MKKITPLVSVIIPTYNSGRTIRQCLESLRKQTYKNIEIIIVDKFSKDKTIEIAKKYNVKIIQSNAEMSEARNIGLKEAKGKYILFIDADMILSPKVIEECVKLAEKDERIGGIVIPEITVGKTLLTKIRKFERSFYENTEIEAARFFRKDLVLKVNGYDSDIIFYEDHTIPQKIEKLGYNVKARINAVIYHDESNLTFWKHLKKKYYYGKTARKYLRKYTSHSLKQVNMFYRYSLFLRNRRFYSKPLLAFGVRVLKSLEYVASSLGCLTELILRRYRR